MGTPSWMVVVDSLNCTLMVPDRVRPLMPTRRTVPVADSARPSAPVTAEPEAFSMTMPTALGLRLLSGSSFL